MAADESSFPRGGAVPVSATASNKAHLFDQTKTKKKVSKNKTKKTKHHRAVTGAQPKLLALEDLSYRTLNEGMVVLGCITEITDYSLHVSLPGFISGRVPVTQISEPYSQLLQSSGQDDTEIDALCPLSELFYKGQLVTAKVWQIRQAEDMRHNVSLSLNPKLVHEDMTHSDLAKKGMIINAAVKSKEEHGYVMDCGVNGLRAFLKEDKALNFCNTFNGGRPLAIGQLVRCIVTKAGSSSAASSVELSADPEDIANEEETGHQSVAMQVLLPGMRFKLTVSEPIIDGVEVKFHSLSGFIHRNHIPQNSKAIEPSLEEGSTVFGRVLYITPLVKNVYLSALTNISSTVKEIPKPSPAEVHFKIGDIVPSGQVTGVGGKGLFLRLGKKNLNVRGFVPERRIGFNYKGKLVDNDDESTMLQRLRTKFPVGSSVRCRLLYFDAMSATYICSMETAVLDEKYLSYSDVHVGDVVPCVVDGVKNGGIAIKVGMLSAFVPAAHSADVPLIHPARKFQEGAKITGRVLKIDTEKNRLIVTFKQSLVTSDDPIIVSYQSARVGLCYQGTVVAIGEKGVFVSFFGNVKGFLQKTLEFVPADHSFFIGQLIKCYVVKRNDYQLRLSMVAPNLFVPNQQACKNVKIGQMYALQVYSVTNKGLSVKVLDQGDSFNASGVIPVYHLSDDIQMAQLLLNTFEVGTVLTNTWCFSDAGLKRPAIFSMRSSVSQFFKTVRGQIASKKTIEAVAPDFVLPCSIRKVDSNFLLLEVPLSSVRSLIRVNSSNVCDKNETIASLGYVEGQAIRAKVLKVLDKSLVLDCRKKSVFKNDLETCIMDLSKHLSDQQRLLAHAKRIGDPLGSFHIGKGVTGTVSERTEWGFVLHLDNGARGETTFYNAHCDDLVIGSRFQGKVLHVDCVRGHVEVILRKDIGSTLKPYSEKNKPSLDPNVQLRGPTLLATPEFILVQLKGAGKLNLAYIPTFLYPQSLQLTVPEPFFGLDRKVIIKRSTGRIILCLPKEVVKFYSRKKPVGRKGKNAKKENTVKKEKNHQDRYFTLDKEIKQEEETEEEDEEEEEKVTQRIWNTENDSKIIDIDEDEISDDESAPLTEEEPDSDMELQASEEQTLPGDEKENLNGSDVLKARKRKSLSGSVEEIEPVSSSKKTKKEKEKVDADSSKTKNKRKGSDDMSNSNSDGIKRKKNDDKEEEQVVDLASDSEDDSSQQTQQTLKNPGFIWDIDPAKFMQVLEPGKQDSSSDEEESDDEKSKKKKRKKSAVERREAARLEEERLQKIEKELLDPNRQLTSCDDFDRMVLANPDSSAVWLQYMAFHLQATEIEKARAVAQRAIKSISYREEQEKLNIWLGLLNLENLYGTAESLKTVLDEALQLNDAYKIRLHMVRLYAESSKNKELDSEVRLVVKKFKENRGMWQDLGGILMSQGYPEKARSILQQALQILKNKKDSVDLIVHFALLEARNNHLEQAKALMDPILASYPKRTDVWCTYCDMLVKANQINEARELLGRSVSQKLPAKKMKTLFTKFLQFETAHGSKEGQDKVRLMATEYVKNAAGDD
ncbi:protein RRP5 homolog [Thrips palmi]|uniref:Protein RRP5 homolog n=1 Tax=Thrips palmi TaxID=161013 RepID=A0A6P9ACE6_THRPL|nr:protein RRP5 homolog [Thrips palmi]XP_034255828.1 protein RRP5 homolog [Thrips palmi]